MQQDSKRSHTAEGVAALRAAGAHERNPDIRNPDYLAERFIGSGQRLVVKIAPLRAASLSIFDRALPGLYWFLTARTKYFDAVLLQEVQAGVQQVVILGAGADSRAYRFADQLAEVQVFELDHPATGAWKQQQIRRLFSSPPKQVSYVPVDFSSEALDEALDRADVKREQQTFFLWEGVVPYLTFEAIDATLAAVARFAEGSSIAFDYLYQDIFTEATSYPESHKFFSYLAKHGEPLLTGFDSAELDDYLARYGLELADHAGPEELVRRHLKDSKGHIQSFAAIAHARVVDPTGQYPESK